MQQDRFDEIFHVIRAMFKMPGMISGRPIPGKSMSHMLIKAGMTSMEETKVAIRLAVERELLDSVPGGPTNMGSYRLTKKGGEQNA